MQPLSLADELNLVPAGPGISLKCDDPGLPQGEDNLVWRAAHLFQRETGMEGGVHITLLKRIPVAAGLGGGSSDAAATLLGLNTMAGAPLNGAGLHRLASQLGADVPFFLTGGPAVGRGIGTELTPLGLPPYWYLLVNPGVPLSTRWVYENLDLAQLSHLPVLDSWDPEHPEGWVHNDLEGVTLRRFPELAELLAQLGQLGARARAVAGSGPTIFGLFSTREEAHRAGRELRRSFLGWLALCRGLTGPAPEAPWENHTWTI